MVSLSVGWIANAFLIAALILVGRKWRHAFSLTLMGELMYLWISWEIDRPDMVALCVVFAVIAGWNWWQWTRPSGAPRAPLSEALGPWEIKYYAWSEAEGRWVAYPTRQRYSTTREDL